MNRDKGIGKNNTIVARIRPDEGLFLDEMCEAFKISRSESIRALVMIGRYVLQDDETGKFREDVLRMVKGGGR